jgi:hypothetical protein
MPDRNPQCDTLHTFKSATGALFTNTTPNTKETTLKPNSTTTSPLPVRMSNVRDVHSTLTPSSAAWSSPATPDITPLRTTSLTLVLLAAAAAVAAAAVVVVVVAYWLHHTTRCYTSRYYATPCYTTPYAETPQGPSREPGVYSIVYYSIVQRADLVWSS